jgi:hypothetical protein
MSVRQQPLLPNNSTWTWSRNVGQGRSIARFTGNQSLAFGMVGEKSPSHQLARSPLHDAFVLGCCG